MDPTSPQEVTQLLLAWSNGDQTALEQLTPLVYAELRKLARSLMARERRGHTLQTTDLVHEAYLRLIDATKVQWQDRAHFFGVCARLMRDGSLVEHARSRQSLKRGGGTIRVDFDEAAVVSDNGTVNLVALDEALKGLAKIDARKSRVVELRFFGGLEVEETAEVLDVSAGTVMRDWRIAKVWLLRELKGDR